MLDPNAKIMRPELSFLPLSLAHTANCGDRSYQVMPGGGPGGKVVGS